MSKKLEFTKEQMKRVDTVNNAAYEYLKVLTGDENLNWDEETIIELNNFAANLMYNNGFTIFYPTVVINEDGTKYITDVYEPDEITGIKTKIMDNAYWDDSRFDKFNENGRIPEYMSVYEIEIPAYSVNARIWARSEEEAREILDQLTDEEFNIYMSYLLRNNESGFFFLLPKPGIRVTNEDIDDIMESAMTGCTYWCERVEPVDHYLGQYANEQISRGGSLKFFSLEDGSCEVLTKTKFRNGLSKWLEKVKPVTEGGRIDPGQMDANDADAIIQYALFDDIIYG